MAIPHAQPASPIDIRPLGEGLKTQSTTTLVKTDTLEVIRMVLPAGKVIPRHDVTGEITLQCMEGLVHVTAGDRQCELAAGQMLFLRGGEPHALHAIHDTSMLLTLLL